MNRARLLAALALLLWGLAIWPGTMRPGKLWILLDRSPSIGQEPELADWLASSQISTEAWREAVEEQRVVVFPSAEGPSSPDLAQALRSLRPRLKPGDRLLVRTDGRSLTPLPDPSDWANLKISALPPPHQPRILQVLAPAHWPQFAECWIQIHFADAHLKAGSFSLREAQGQVSVHEILNQSSNWLAVKLHCARPPKENLQLQLQWEEAAGVASTLLRMAPPSVGQGLLLSPETPVARIRQALAQGQVVTLVSDAFSPWLALPSDLALFQPREAEWQRPLWVLLDVSGSMEGDALEEAKSMLALLVKNWHHGPVRVVPFQERLLETRVLQQASDLAMLQNLEAFGPTNLVQAVRSLSTRLQGESVLFILSDGAAGHPNLDWKDLLQQQIPQTTVYCLPTGPRAQWDFLSGLGEVLTQGTLTQRLDKVLVQIHAGEKAPSFPQTEASFPLPEQWMPSHIHPAWDPASGVEPLMLEAAGPAYFVARRVGRGLLLGVADEKNSNLGKLIAPIEQGFLSPGRDGWVGDRFLLYSQESVPQCIQAGKDLAMRMADAGPPIVWEARNPSKILAVEVHEDSKQSWVAGPLLDLEHGADPQAWFSWLENQGNTLSGVSFRPRLLWAGLFLLTIAFVLRSYSER